MPPYQTVYLKEPVRILDLKSNFYIRIELSLSELCKTHFDLPYSTGGKKIDFFYFWISY